jgi:hypothetical protein
MNRLVFEPLGADANNPGLVYVACPTNDYNWREPSQLNHLFQAQVLQSVVRLQYATVSHNIERLFKVRFSASHEQMACPAQDFFLERSFLKAFRNQSRGHLTLQCEAASSQPWPH